jgi:HAD superfamily hydrolase (TIGR01509 family)
LQDREIIPRTIIPAQLLEEKIAALLELADGPIPVYPDAKETLQGLSASHTICAASNSAGRFTTRILKNAGLFNLFSLVLTRDDIRDPKPAPDIYLKCASDMNVRPAECLVIEDSPVGVAAAKAAGMTCIAITHTVNAESLRDADAVLDILSPVRVVEYAHRCPSKK